MIEESDDTDKPAPPVSEPCCEALGALLALAAAATVVLAACGSSATTTSPTSSSRGAQVLYTVKSGDLTESASGSVKLTSTAKGKATASVQFIGPEAAQVAAGRDRDRDLHQAASGRKVWRRRAPERRAQPGQRPGLWWRAQRRAQPGSSGGLRRLGFRRAGRLPWRRLRPGRGVPRWQAEPAPTVTAVQAGQNGSATATIIIAKLPSGVTSKYAGFAQVTVKTLAQNVLIVPRAAIKGSGSNATVQLLQNGSTMTQGVTVGQETQTEAEITAGLSAGQNIIYTRTFSGFPGGRSGGGFPGSGQGGMPSGDQGGILERR